MASDRATTLLDSLLAIRGLKVKQNEPLARYTTMKIGGPADYFLEVDARPALAQALKVLSEHRVPFCLLGKGSNVLVSDRGVRGAVIRLGEDFKRAAWREEAGRAFVEVGAAHAMTQLVREAARRGFGGLEFGEGIPGSVGGALYMNAGAYGSEMEKIVERVEGATPAGDAVAFARDQMTFGYRDSNLPPGTIVTAVTMRLEKQDAAEVSTRVRDLVARRKSSQPAGFPNSGSMFRNPPGDFAGRLIEAAGWKGRRIGQAQISERHGNFIVNHGGATAADVKALMDGARTEVKNKFGLELVPEVRFLGDW
ncbi:MAG TPA: UDP-N-acetylmuramate dehydrogenase [Candidatus Binatia bacterium]|jgi:UDP-N-acetylmuramate dehydrogenase